MDFEIKTSLVGESHDFFENEPDRLDEERVDEGVNNFAVLVSGVLLKNNLILDKEVRDVVV